MQARSPCQPTHLNGYNPLRRPSYPLTHLRQSPPRPASPPSPLARYHAVDGWPSITSGRRSVCDLIPEEAQGLSSDLSATLHNHIDLSLEFLKRHHKPKPSLNRAASDPQILSTNTTQPVHIPKSPYVSLPHPHRPSPSSRTMATLAPRADSFNARVRGSSHIDFKTATTGVAAKAMRNEISRIVGTVEDPATKKVCPIHPPLTYPSFEHRRHSIPRCRPFFTSSPGISRNVLRALICQYFLFRSTALNPHVYRLFLVTGIASNLLPRTRLFPMTR